MLHMKDTETGLSLTLTIQSKPKNPRLAEGNLFEIVTWTPGLGDPHDWHSARHLLSAINADTTTIFPLENAYTPRGQILMKARKGKHRPAGFAIAPHDLLKLEFEVSEITSDVTARAEEACLVELQTFEEYVAGHVFSFEITDRHGIVLEHREDLYGQDYAESIAQTAFHQHRMSIQIDG